MRTIVYLVTSTLYDAPRLRVLPADADGPRMIDYEIDALSISRLARETTEWLHKREMGARHGDGKP